MATPEDIAAVVGIDLRSVLIAACAEGAPSSIQPATALTDRIVRGVVVRLRVGGATDGPRDPDVDRLLKEAKQLARQRASDVQLDLRLLVGQGTFARLRSQANEDERRILRFLQMSREERELEERQRDEYEAREAALRRQEEVLARVKRASAERAIRRDRVNELHAADDERQWDELGFTDWERDVWVSSGMPRRLAHVARACVDHGIAPSDLQRPVGAMTVVELLEAGEAPAAVSAQLWRARRAQRA